MPVDNLTEFPPAGVRNVVAWVFRDLRLPLGRVMVRVMRTDHWHHLGHFYVYKRGKFLECLITARIPKEIGAAHDRGYRGGPPPINPRDWKETLVCAVAHEGTHLLQLLEGEKTEGHIRQTKQGPKRVRGRIFSEVDAEWAEYRALQRWRERRER